MLQLVYAAREAHTVHAKDHDFGTEMLSIQVGGLSFSGPDAVNPTRTGAKAIWRHVHVDPANDPCANPILILVPITRTTVNNPRS